MGALVFGGSRGCPPWVGFRGLTGVSPVAALAAVDFVLDLTDVALVFRGFTGVSPVGLVFEGFTGVLPPGCV